MPLLPGYLAGPENGPYWVHRIDGRPLCRVDEPGNGFRLLVAASVPQPAGQWALDAGTHHGTVMSRDSAVTRYDTVEAACEAWEHMYTFWRRMGLRVWYARLRPPSGDPVTLRRSEHYV